jgi:hypothetical protein
VPVEAREVGIPSAGGGELPGLLLLPPEAWALLVLAHGAGAGMRHPFMQGCAVRLGERGIATLRHEFPYMARGGRRPDPPPVLCAAVRDAVGQAGAAGLPLLAGGKSLGGRMTSTAAAQGLLPQVRGLAFLGFPLHAAGHPGSSRAAHLGRVRVPMLFLQGTRDALADLPLLEPVCRDLGDRATLRRIDAADHGFHVPKRSGRTDADVLDELAEAVAEWSRPLCHGRE